MELTVQKRETFGKANKALRKEGFIPAEVYGSGVENLHISVNAKDFVRLFKEAGESTIVYLVIDGEKQPVLIQDTQQDRLTQDVTHIDFYKVKMDEEITATIPLKFIGESSVVKDKLGALNKSITEVEVETLPGDLPQSIEVDLSVLVDLEKSIHIKDLKVSDKVKILLEPDTVVVSVLELRAEEVVEEKPADVSEVKVEGEEKKAEKAEAGKGENKEEAK